MLLNAGAELIRFLSLFLVGYAAVAFGVLLTLWQIGVFSRAGPVWTGLGMLIAISLGIMLSMSLKEPAQVEAAEG